MVEGIIGSPDMVSMAQTIGIVGTMILTLYFSKRQIQSLSIDQEARVLDDLDEKFHKMAELIMEDPSIGKVIDNQVPSRELAFSFYIYGYVLMYMQCARGRCLMIMYGLGGYNGRNCFRKRTIKETWKRVEQDRWFNPAFQDFVNTEIVGGNLRT
jgi:hypothetical protein